MQLFVRLFWCLVWLSGAAVIVLFVLNDLLAGINAGGSSLLLEIGRLCGLVGTYFILWQLVLISRLPFLESGFGFNFLTRVHRWNGLLGITLITAHVAYITIGSAGVNSTGIVAEFIDLLTTKDNVLVAAIAFVMFLTIVALSITIVRRHLRFETWYAVHITAYLAILLAQSHQFSVGDDIINASVLSYYWIALYACAFGVIVLFRIGQPLYRYWRYRFKVSRVHIEATDTISIYVCGRNLKRFSYTAGQYAIWRFLTPDLWLQEHPFSISVAPGSNELRLTVKAVGDYTTMLQRIKPGSPVVIDGPHGDFTLARTGRPLLFIAGGIGITPLRAMLESLPENMPPPVLLYAARSQANLALRSELEQLLSGVGGRMYCVLSDEAAAGFYHGNIDKSLITKLVPDVASRDIMLCGPPVMMRKVSTTLQLLGVKRTSIYTERFAFLG